MSAEMSWTMALNDDLKWFRNAMGLSREQAAKIFGVSSQTLKRWENGEQSLEDIAAGTYRRLVSKLNEWQKTVENRAKRHHIPPGKMN